MSQFYNEASKTVVDVHEEAKRLAAQKKATSASATPPPELATAHDSKSAEAGIAPPVPGTAFSAPTGGETSAPSAVSGEKAPLP